MKGQNVVLTMSVLALSALTRQRFIGLDGNLCAAGAKALAVAEYDTDAGNMAPGNVLGVILVEAGAAVAPGTEVQSDASGKAITKAAGVGNGFALDEATADGDLIRIVRGI
ncbi:DUF2190 family protein [Pseudomonas aeruginosa]|uniref:DUF2190 family protein n=1 Tax=Pseudomonas aeruginosa TaxID=287 RepID=UPI0023B25A11|nr:DUF2190 family protein [Pseudomonas aeruginosa]MDE9812438.1 DUF2190 family protein [Pseudomonas aeruginosa]